MTKEEESRSMYIPDEGERRMARESGRALRIFRTLANLNMGDLATLTGFSVSQISKMELGDLTDGDGAEYLKGTSLEQRYTSLMMRDAQIALCIRALGKKWDEMNPRKVLNPEG